MTHDEPPRRSDADPATGDPGAADDAVSMRIPVIEERIEVAAHRVATGGYRIEKSIERQARTIDEPLTREQVSIERRAVGRLLGPTEVPTAHWRGDVLVVPVFEEVLVVEKRLRLVEEVLIRREQTEFRAPQHVVLRREHVSVRDLDDDREGERSPGSAPGSRPADPNQSRGSSTMTQTLIGVFDTREDALQARDRLLQAGFASGDVTVQAEQASAESRAASPDVVHASSSTAGTHRHEGGIAHFFRSLFGLDDDDEDVGVYSEAVRRGGHVVSVDVAGDDECDRAESILRQCGAIDLDERSASWRAEGWRSDPASITATTGASVAGGALGAGEVLSSTTADASLTRDAADLGAQRQTIPVVEEDLRVGKREVRTGGIRVFTRVAEVPVEQSLDLREEHAHVERHPVDRPASERDLQAMSEAVIEVRESAEQPVVQKQARVVEEVEIGKTVSRRQATVRDTVRRTEVEVEDLEREHALARERRDADTARSGSGTRAADDGSITRKPDDSGRPD